MYLKYINVKIKIEWKMYNFINNNGGYFMKPCSFCHFNNDDYATQCVKCSNPFPNQYNSYNNNYQNSPQPNNYQNYPPPYNPNFVYPYKSNVVALLLCLFFGLLGVHRFYVGKVGTDQKSVV